MFVLCPHCQFLLAVDPASGQPPSVCPRCGQPAPPLVAAHAPRDDVQAPARVRVDTGGDASTSAAPPQPRPGAGDVEVPAPGETPQALAPSPAEAGATLPPTAGNGELPAPETPSAIAAPEEDASTPSAEAPDAMHAGQVDSALAPMGGDGAPADAGAGVAGDTRAADDAGTVEGLTPVDDRSIDGAPLDNAPLSSAPLSSAPRRRAPSFVRGATASATKSPRRRWLVPGAIAMLASSLLLQVVLADRAQLARDARWRPLVAGLCDVLRCSVPAWHEPSAITLLDRDVRPDPRKPGVLHVTASFRNDARWPQRWPMLLLTLSDVDGRIAGTRSFTPREYLDGATQNELSSGQSASIAMDIVEPSPSVVAFTFDFQ